MSVRASDKAARFTESVIREMTRLAHLHGAVNLSQGFPDFPAPSEVKEAARRAIEADINQYAITWGARSLRQAIARKLHRLYGVTVESGRFDILKNSVGHLTDHGRLQMMLVAFAFGAFIEGRAGFGTPVAVASS